MRNVIFMMFFFFVDGARPQPVCVMASKTSKFKHFYVDLTFSQSVEFHVKAYGKEAMVISAPAALKYSNVNKVRCLQIY